MFGVLLYAVAHNRLLEWRTFSQVDFGTFPDIQTPKLYASSLEQLSQMVGLESAAPPP
jgi:hypothetical protein